MPRDSFHTNLPEMYSVFGMERNRAKLSNADAMAVRLSKVKLHVPKYPLFSSHTRTTPQWKQKVATKPIWYGKMRGLTNMFNLTFRSLPQPESHVNF